MVASAASRWLRESRAVNIPLSPCLASSSAYEVSEETAESVEGPGEATALAKLWSSNQSAGAASCLRVRGLRPTRIGGRVGLPFGRPLSLLLV